ncbi:MAG: TonB-dependent receptor [Sphingobium sp.]
MNHKIFDFRAVTVSAAALAVALGHPASAADDREDHSVRDEIIVTGTALNLDVPQGVGSRLGLSSLETPASIAVIGGDAIRAQGEMSIVDAVARAPGFTTASGPADGGVLFTARGFGGVNSVMTLYDGVQMIVGQGTVTFPFDPWMVGRIQVLNGPASVLQGNGALGGVVNVVPRRPDPDRTSASFRVAAGSFETVRAGVDLTGPLGGGLSYRLTGSRIHSGGYLPRGQSSSDALSASLRYDVTPDFFVQLSHDYGYQKPSSVSTPLNNGRIDDRFVRRNYNADGAYIAYRDNWTTLRSELRASDALKLRLTAYRLEATRVWAGASSSFIYVPANDSVTRNVFTYYTQKHEQLGAKLDATISTDLGGRSNDLVIGVDYDHVKFNRVALNPADRLSSPADMTDPGRFILYPFTAANGYSSYDSVTDRVAVFAEDRLEITDRLSLVAGARVDHYKLERQDVTPAVLSRKSYTPFSWRVGTVYKLADHVAFYGQYSTAVESVGSLVSLSVNQQTFNLSHGDQFEAGLKASFLGGRGEATLAAYRIVKKDLLQADPERPGQSLQIGQQSSRGVEASLSFAVTPSLNIQANGTLLKPKYDDFAENVGGVVVSRAGNRPVSIPNKTANLIASWEAVPGIELQSNVRYVGARYGDVANLRPLDDYILVDLGLRLTPIEGVTVHARVYNLTDKIYVVQGGGTNQAYLGRPRAFELSLTGSF